MDPEERNIGEVFFGIYKIPVYQRPYSWDIEQVKQLLDDFDASFSKYEKADKNDEQSTKDRFAFFVGTLFLQYQGITRGTYPNYVVVDGQQRITTITLLLMVILNKLYMPLQSTKTEQETINNIENLLWKKLERKNNKDDRELELGNIDKKILTKLFDTLFEHKDIIAFAKEQLETANEIEKKLLYNLILIDEHMGKYNIEKMCDYYDYIKIHVCFITIEVTTEIQKLFNIFESINSKGKPLDELDLIKSYIFQLIPQKDYNEYLDIWGELIEGTNDNLMDYLTVYVRGNIAYYIYSIKLKTFKYLVDNGLENYYATTNNTETVKSFIKDLKKNMKYYRMLSNISELEKMKGITKKIASIFAMNELADYKHTRALYFKLLTMFANNQVETSIFENIAEAAFKFILTFQSVSSRESKYTITTFVKVENLIYGKNKIDKVCMVSILSIFDKTIGDNVITTESLRNAIVSELTYKKSKKVLKVILSYLEALDADGKIQYDKLLCVLRANKELHLDHISPLKPDKKEKDFYYYFELQNGKIYLKEGNDFVVDKGAHEFQAEDFYDKYLNVIGNIRLAWSSENEHKSNHIFVLKDTNEKFHLNNQISKRMSGIVNRILYSGLILSKDNINIGGKIKAENVKEIKSYDKKIEYKNFVPISFTFLDSSYVLAKDNYRNLLSQVVDVIYELDHNTLQGLAKKRYAPMQSNRTYITTDFSSLKRPYRIADNIYVETNLSSEYVVKLVYLLVREVGLNESDLCISLQEQEN